MDSWTCHVCGDERPDDLIGVVSTDVSADYNLPPGTMKQNVRYCLDRPGCVEDAKTYRFAPTDAVGMVVQRRKPFLSRLLRR